MYKKSKFYEDNNDDFKLIIEHNIINKADHSFLISTIPINNENDINIKNWKIKWNSYDYIIKDDDQIIKKTAIQMKYYLKTNDYFQEYNKFVNNEKNTNQKTKMNKIYDKFQEIINKSLLDQDAVIIRRKNKINEKWGTNNKLKTLNQKIKKAYNELYLKEDENNKKQKIKEFS